MLPMGNARSTELATPIKLHYLSAEHRTTVRNKQDRSHKAPVFHGIKVLTGVGGAEPIPPAELSSAEKALLLSAPSASPPRPA